MNYEKWGKGAELKCGMIKWKVQNDRMQNAPEVERVWRLPIFFQEPVSRVSRAKTL
jgi:hypothetical protein